MKNLDQIRHESKEIKEKINDTEERLRQLKNKDKYVKRAIWKEQKNGKKKNDSNEVQKGRW